jgi:hypothetical protein
MTSIMFGNNLVGVVDQRSKPILAMPCSRDHPAFHEPHSSNVKGLQEITRIMYLLLLHSYSTATY